MTTFNSPTVPGTYICLVADVVARWGISPEQLLEGSSVSPVQLQEPIWHVHARTAGQIINRAVELTQEPGLGFHIGMQMNITCHGLIGFAAMIAKDVRSAIEIAQEFIKLQSSTLKIKLEVKKDTAHLYFQQSQEFPLGEVFVFALLLGFAQMGKAITGKTLTGIADIEFEQPDYYEKFKSLLPGAINFNQSHTRLSFPAEYLDYPLLMADQTTARLAREQCKRELYNTLKQGNFSTLVQELAYDEVSGFFTAEEVAEKLHLSFRTLQRKLADEGKTFRNVIEDKKLKLALSLLKNNTYTMDYIAEHLGYTDVSNFSRAFKRWTGESPGKYRR